MRILSGKIRVRRGIAAFPFPKASLANEGIKMIFNSRIPDMVKGSAHESLHLALAYTFINGGKLIQPVLDSSEQDNKPQKTREVLDSPLPDHQAYARRCGSDQKARTRR